MQIFYRPMTSSVHALEVEASDTVAMVMGEIGKREGVDPSGFYLLGNGTRLEEDRTLASYNIQKHSTITMTFRLKGGGLMLDAEALLQVLGADVASAIATLRVRPNETCVCCTEDGPCVVFCHTKLCVAECAEAQLRAAKMQFKCFICHTVTGTDDLFPRHPTMLQYGRTLKDVKQLTRNCDVQVCECGAMNVNETMFAQQQCPMCRRVACFFCNRKWCARAVDGQKAMVNHRFYCNDDCTLKVKLTYSLVDFQFTGAGVSKIPVQRCCPMCFEPGAYDMKCKYHTCTCGHRLCFLCLRPEAECKALGSNYNRPCKGITAIPEQSFDMFPRLISPPQ